MYIIKRDDQYWNKASAEFHDQQANASRFDSKPIDDPTVLIQGSRYVRLKLKQTAATDGQPSQ